MKQNISVPICPECNSCNFSQDTHHHEVYCKSCGLVILSPPTTDFITDGYKHLIIEANFKDIEVIIENQENTFT